MSETALAELDSGTRERVVDAGGLAMHLLEAGEGDPIILLHGFPDFCDVWRPLIDRLAGQCRIVAPDLRGYNLSERPVERDAYAVDRLIGDVIGLLDVLGIARAVLCGHDWGGLLAAWIALRHPDRVRGMILLNAPPPHVFQDLVWDDPQQRAASQYISVLRSPAADEVFCETNVEALIERFLAAPRAAGLLTTAQIDAYRAAWTRPGVWQAMLAWYRAAPFDVPAPDARAPTERWTAGMERRIVCPVQVIWGLRDVVFVPRTPALIAWNCADCDIAELAEVGHVPQREDPVQCAEIISRFMASLARKEAISR